MLYVDGNGTIRLTRGDTAKLTVSINNEVTESPYDISENDELVLTVKKTVNDKTPCIQKKIVGSYIFVINPSDTESLAFGKYKYDVQLNKENGEVYTIIEPTVFEIMQEVTY